MLTQAGRKTDETLDMEFAGKMQQAAIVGGVAMINVFMVTGNVSPMLYL